MSPRRRPMVRLGDLIPDPPALLNAYRERTPDASSRDLWSAIATDGVFRIPAVRLAEALSHGLPAIAYDRRSSGSEAYWKVAMELVERS